jgi:putative ABC transport system permease protein
VGRNFSKEIATDDSLAFIINEAAARALGWTNLKDHVNEDFEYAETLGKLIGIVKDFHFESLHQEIVPMIFLASNRFGSISIKLSGNTGDAIAHVQNVWKQFAPARPFDYQFLDETYEALYDAEQKQAKLFTAFSGLAIFIASLGLFGLATFNAMQRVKEIGIRKVLGATVPQIFGLLSKEIVILILVANFLAWPVAYYFMGEWLSGFAYHIDMNIFVYIGSAFVAVLIAIITISAQTLKAATSNPAQTLKYE